MEKTWAVTIAGKSKQQAIREIEKRLAALKKMEDQLSLVLPLIRHRRSEHNVGAGSSPATSVLHLDPVLGSIGPIRLGLPCQATTLRHARRRAVKETAPVWGW